MKEKNIKIKYSPRTRVRLDEWEHQLLSDFVKNDPSAKWVIQENTGINPRTVDRMIEKGFTELAVAVRLRDFLKILKKEQLWNKGLPDKQ